MRKNSLKLIKKTEEWLHRSKGKDSIALPEETTNKSLRFFKIFGNTELSEDGSYRSVGDYNDENGNYSIDVHVHGKNFMSGSTFAQIHKTSKVTSYNAIISGYYNVKIDMDDNGTVVIDKRHIRFKEKTAYTIAAHLKFQYANSQRDFNLRFDYSDGTSDFPIIYNNAYMIYDCAISDPNKTLVSISSYAVTEKLMRYGIADFGIYEGTHTDFYAINEPYDGEKISITLSEPLRKMSYVADELDLLNGKITRKIYKTTINASSPLAFTANDGIFEIMLPRKARTDTGLISSYAPLSETGSSGIAFSRSGNTIYFKADDSIISAADILSYLAENPFEITYVLYNYETENVDINIPYREKETIIELFSEVSPSKTVAEYV